MGKVGAAASAGETSLMARLAEQRRVEVAAEVERQVEARLLAEREEAADAAVRCIVGGPAGPAATRRPQPRGSVAEEVAPPPNVEVAAVGVAEAMAVAAAAEYLEEAMAVSARDEALQAARWVDIDPVRFSPFPCGKASAVTRLPTPPTAPPPPWMARSKHAQEEAPPPTNATTGATVEEGKDAYAERTAAKAADGGDWRVPRVPTPPPPPARRAKATGLEGVPTPPAPLARPEVVVSQKPVTHNQIQRARAKTDGVLKAKLDSFGDEKKRIKEARRSWIASTGLKCPCQGH